MWLDFFKHCNGLSVFHDRFWVSNDDEKLSTDSCGGIGFGIWFQGHWCHEKWPACWKTKGFTRDITMLELFPIVVATVIFGEQLRNKKIRFNCDNKAVVHILNTQTSKSPSVLALLRVLTMQCIKFNCLIKASHIPGAKNDIADALSRFQLQRFRTLAPTADARATPMPDHLWNLSKVDLDNWFSQEFHNTQSLPTTRP